MHVRPQCLAFALILVAHGCIDDQSSGFVQLDSDAVPDAASPDTNVVAGEVATELAADVATADEPSGPEIAHDADVASDVVAPADAHEVTPSGPTVAIIVAGELEDRSPDDGLAAQTPRTYRYGLRRLELLRGMSDPNPEVIFDHEPGFIEVDMLGRTEVARVPMADLPTGEFPYFRIVLTHLDASIDATLHAVPVIGELTTRLDVRYALSRVTLDAVPFAPGDARITADIYGQPYSVMTAFPVPAPSPAPGAWASAVDGEWQVTFPVEPAFVPSPRTPTDVTYTVHFYVKDSFRWRDLESPGYAADRWDLTMSSPPAWEPVERFGANDYAVTIQVGPMSP